MTPQHNPIDRLKRRLERVRPSGDGWTARCPAHDDTEPSLSIDRGKDGCALLNCHAGCSTEAVVKALGLEMSDLFPAEDGGRSKRRGWTVEDYATYVGVPAEWLRREFGVRTKRAPGESPTVAVPYRTPDGEIFRTRYRTRDRFWWGDDGKGQTLYGLHRLADADPERAVLLVEGESDVHACAHHQRLAVGVPGASSWHSSWARHLEGRDVYLWKEPDAAGRRLASDVAEDLPEARVIEAPGDAEDPAALHHRGPKAFQVRVKHLARRATPIRELGAAAERSDPDASSARVENTTSTRSGGYDGDGGASGTSGTPKEGWGEPISLGPEPPDNVPADVLPSPLREHVESVADSTQVPTALPVGIGLAAVSTALAGKAKLDLRGDWDEPLNLYVAVVLDPANRKSAVETEMAAPLRSWEQEQAQEKGPEERAAIDRREALEKRLKRAKKDLSKASGSEDEGAALEEMRETRRRIENLDVPRPERLLANDVTPEALGRLMAEQHGRAAIISSEGDVLRNFAGKYSAGDPTLEILKKGWSGDPVRVDRVARDGVHLPRPLLTVGLTLQETLLRTLANRDVLVGEGVLARFLWMAPPSPIGERLTGSEVPVPDREARDRYEGLLRRLLTLGPARVNKENGRWRPHALHLTPGARDKLWEFEDAVEGMLADGGDLVPIRSWGGKLVGNTARVAGLLHVIRRVGRGAGEDPFGAPIPPETMNAAVRLGRALVPHARHVLAGEVEMDSELSLARYVLRRIREADDPELTKRNLWHLTKGKAEINETSDLDPILETLKAHRLVRVERRESTGGRRPSPWLKLNPRACGESTKSTKSDGSGDGSPTSGTSGTPRPGAHTAERLADGEKAVTSETSESLHRDASDRETALAEAGQREGAVEVEEVEL